MMKLFSLIFLILGNFIGAGFASGKEIFAYFARFGYVSLLSVVLIFFLLGYLFKKCLYLGKFSSDNNLLNKNIIISCSIITMAAMLSGSFNVGNDYSLFIGIAFFILFIIIYIFVMYRGLNCISIINFILVPIMIIFIVINLIFNLKVCNYNFDFKYLSAGQSILYSIVYISMNMFSLGCFLIEIGKNYSLKQIKIASRLSSFIICIIISFAIICFNQNGITNKINVPMQLLAKNLGGFFYNIFSLVLLFSMFTTLISSGFVIKSVLKDKDKNYKKIIIPFIFSLCISILGFNFIINKLYFLVGIFGFFFIFKLIINLKITKKRQNL